MKRIEQFIKNIFKINAKQLIVLMLGLVIAHLGVALFILTNLGSDPYNVLIQGISRTIKMSHGTCHQGLSLFILIIIFIVARSYIKIGTILCMIFGGPIIDFFGKLLGNIINESLPFFVRILISCIGCIVLAFGMSIVVQSKAGAGPNDLISVVLSDKTKKSFGLCRIGVDFTLLLLGFLLKGTIGLGTILCLLLVGPVAGKFMNLSEKLVKKYI